MKLLGFEGHEITSINYEVIGAEEIEERLKRNIKEKEEDNILIEEEVNIQLTKELTKTLISGIVVVIDTVGYRKIAIEIKGEFIFENEGEKDPKVISELIYNEFWPTLRKYVSPAISTLTSITNRGELEINL